MATKKKHPNQRVAAAFSRGAGFPTPYGKRANGFQDTWNTLRSGYPTRRRKRP